MYNELSLSPIRAIIYSETRRNSMKKSIHAILIIAVILAFLPAGSGRAGSALPAGHPSIPAAASASRVYLPLIQNRPTPPDSLSLIDQAVAGGQISAEQGLIYKAFAAWGDGRLPLQFKGSVE